MTPERINSICERLRYGGGATPDEVCELWQTALAAVTSSGGPSSSQSEPTFEQKYPHVTKALLLAALRENAVHPADAASPTILRAIAEGVEAGGISPDTAARHLRAAADELEMQNRLMPRGATTNPISEEKT